MREFYSYYGMNITLLSSRLESRFCIKCVSHLCGVNPTTVVITVKITSDKI